MKFEAIVSSLGDFGPYQKRIYFLLCLVAIPHACQVLGILFIMGNQNHRCLVPGLSNDTYSVLDDWHRDVIHQWIPIEDDGSYSPCNIYQRDPNTHLPTNTTTTCSSYVYDKSVFQTTITSDEDLVCDRKHLKTYANMIFMAGMLTGSVAMGSLSDIVGRKTTLMTCIAGHLISALATVFVQSYVAFVVLRFITANFSMGMFLTAFVIGMEIVGPSTRKFAGIIIEVFWVFGLLLNMLLAYFIPYAKYLQIAIVCPSALLLSYAFLIPESPRWLIRKGRVTQACQILQKAAKVNKVPITESMVNVVEVEENDGPTAKIWQMFTVRVLLVRTLVLIYAWFSSSMVYYGLSLNVSALSGDIYVNQVFYALAEGISYICCLLFLDKLGRKPMIISSSLLAGVSCLATIFPVIYGSADQGWLTVTLSMVGKFGSSITFAVVFIYSAEVFPTTTRNLGIGICSFAARVGGILAPYVADLGNIVGGDMGVVLPLVIFGGASLLSGFLVFVLPETTNRILPESIQDAKEFGRSPSQKGGNADEKSNPDSHFKGSCPLLNGDESKAFIQENGHNGTTAA